FIRFTCHLKQEIILGLVDVTIPPSSLPNHVQQFLLRSLELSKNIIDLLWKNLCQYIWELDDPYLDMNERALFDNYGSQTERKERRLGMSYAKMLIQFLTTHGYSILHVLSSLYFLSILRKTLNQYFTSCDTCNIRYYCNYHVDLKNYWRTYYSSTIPTAVHVEEQSYVQTSLSELFTSCTLFAWVSFQNCATIYNHALSPYRYQAVYDSKYILTSTQVWRTFVLVSLLKDWNEHGRTLSFLDSGELNLRLKEVMCERNDRMVTEGQPEQLHAWSLRAVVTDGVTLGHPCCKVHNCTEPLENNRHHWCKTHSQQKLLCSFTDCARPACPGKRTCDEPLHRRYEEYRLLKGKGFFLLRQRLQRAGVIQLSSSISSSSAKEDDLLHALELDEGDEDPVHKSDQGNRPAKAMFARRRTHNEQLVVCTCGVIAARATMYGAEAISGVKDFLKSVYPNRLDLPDVIFFDNNCQLQAHLQAQNDLYFQQVMLPVDVFHFKSKHKESDEFCQRHCNPSQWTELVGDDGEWVFNSSAAEQGNVWIGGYQAIVREMLVHNYNFFLDEMIKRRNEVLVAKLRREGKNPYHIPPYHHIE
ncbi:hypothetical protein EV360DRAFT_57709, partial [Lentinula raphanica]